MPLHRNESSSGKTINFVGQDLNIFVKENYMLSRERATVMVCEIFSSMWKIFQHSQLLNSHRRVISTLTDYSVHLELSIKEAIYKKEYFLIIIGGGITGDIQCNETHYHKKAKALYRDREMAMMIDKLNLFSVDFRKWSDTLK